jgi:E3 ubiquitin-protein ligase UBR7
MNLLKVTPLSLKHSVSVDEMLVTMLESMDRTVALESIYAFEHLKKGLKEYLKEFAKDGRVVEPQDIMNFFEVKH